MSKNQTALPIETWPIDKAIDYPKNARKWSKHAIAKVAASIKAYGFRQPIVVDKHGVIVIGHLRRTAARTLGMTEVPVHVARDLSEAQCRGLRLMDNRTALESTFDLEMLGTEFMELKALDFDLSLTGFDIEEIQPLIDPQQAKREANETLAQRFGLPPFSVLDARQGYWQDRKRAWLALGIESELGRGGGHLEGVPDRQPS